MVNFLNIGRRVNLILAGALLFCFLVLNQAAFASESCLEYEPKTVELTGNLIREIHPGPPNYEDISKGDRKESIWVMLLDEAICVHPLDDLNPGEVDQKEVQLVLNREKYKKYKELVNRKVKVKGTMFHSFSGHHYRKLLISVVNMERNA